MRSWLVVCLWCGLSLSIGCGDDGGDGDNPVTDASVDSGGGTSECPPGNFMPPDHTGLMGECCYRKSNASDLANPEFKLSSLLITAPASLDLGGLVYSLLQRAVDEERFNWLIRIQGADADGTVSATTGYGNRNENATFSFLDGNAPSPGAPDRWDPITISNATLTGETITAPALNESFTVPIFDVDAETVLIELPLRDFELISMAMSEQRSCVGLAGPTSYDVTLGELKAYIAVEDAIGRALVVSADNPGSPPLLDTTLCKLAAGLIADTESDDCDDVPQADWGTQPTALCDENGCETGSCTPATDCNAWEVTADFAAHGVEITD